MVFIQQMDGQFQDDWVFAAFIGANKHGYRVAKPGEKVYFDSNTIIFFEDQNQIPAKANPLVVADIDTTLAYFDRIGYTPPAPLNIPPELRPFASRSIGECTLGLIKHGGPTLIMPLFIKPKNKLKEFAAGVLSRPQDLNFLLKEGDKPAPPDETEVFWSTPIDMISEYRCFVTRGKLEGIQWYAGDFTVFPDAKRIHQMIDAYKHSPSCYTLDVAVADSAETVIVEVNDAWSVGNYGFEGKDYFRFLNIRWREMMIEFAKQKQNTTA